MSPICIPLVLLALSGAEPSAEASTEPSAHPWRLHAEVAPLRLYLSRSPWIRSQAVRAGMPGGLSVGFGRALGRYVLVGARLGGEVSRSWIESLTGDGREWRRGKEIRGSGWIAPYVEVRLRPSRRVQPFGLVEGGVGVEGTRRRFDGSPSDFRYGSAGPMLGGRAGLHAFVLPRLSIDADLGVRRDWRRQWSSSSIVAVSVEAPGSVEDAVLVRLTGTIGLSGWW